MSERRGTLETLQCQDVDRAPCTPLPKNRGSWASFTVTPMSSSSTLSSLRDSPITPPNITRRRTSRQSTSLTEDLSAAFEAFQVVEHPPRLRFHSQSQSPNPSPSSGSPIPKAGATQLRLDKRIGSGQWSNVYLGEVKQSNEAKENQRSETACRVVAVKVAADKSSVKVLKREAYISAYIETIPRHEDFVVQFLGLDRFNDSIVLEHIALGLDQLVASETESTETLRSIMKDLICGLAFLHEARVIHGDIKPANIRVRCIEDASHTKTCQPVYGDFSASRFDEPDSESSESAGTYDYMAPELFKVDSQSTTASDVYALGMTFVYMAIGRSPYSHCPNLYMRRAMAMQGRPLEVVTDTGEYLKFESTKARALIKDSLRLKPELRPTAMAWQEKVKDLGP